MTRRMDPLLVRRRLLTAGLALALALLAALGAAAGSPRGAWDAYSIALVAVAAMLVAYAAANVWLLKTGR
ncbi:MAG TPA: hypothetical protein VI997_00350 [Candidatus Thermoplasmatota archaeon]|nr:hypothetical protein [Candidatus Thermoplasmatota archaeon]